METKVKSRLHLLDALRGFLMINMIAYHAMWNMVNLFGFPAGWYTGTTKYLWQQAICWSFILLSGFCWSMSRSHLRRGLLVFGGGVAVSLVTNILMPENRILFGILTCIGSCVLLMIPLEQLLKKVPSGVGMAVSFCLFLLLRNCPRGNLGFEGFVIAQLPDWQYRNMLTAYLGFPHPGFFSTDYFSLLPWLLLFVTGVFPVPHSAGRAAERKAFRQRTGAAAESDRAEFSAGVFAAPTRTLRCGNAGIWTVEIKIIPRTLTVRGMLTCFTRFGIGVCRFPA